MGHGAAQALAFRHANRVGWAEPIRRGRTRHGQEPTIGKDPL